jgi:hypothetical protein
MRHRPKRLRSPDLGKTRLAASVAIWIREPGRQRSGIEIPLQYVVCELRELGGAGPVSGVEAGVGAAQREIGVEPPGRAEQESRLCEPTLVGGESRSALRPHTSAPGAS